MLYVLIAVSLMVAGSVLFFRHDIGDVGTVVVEYDPPHDLSPAEVGLLFDDKIQAKEVTAEIIGLAIRGYLRIRRIPGTENDYLLEKLKYEDDLPNGFQRELVENIFVGNMKPMYEDRKPFSQLTENARTIRLSELSRLFRSTDLIMQGVAESLKRKGYYNENVYLIKNLSIAGLLALTAGAVRLGAEFGPAIFLVAMSIVGLSVWMIWNMPMANYLGRSVRRKIMGLKRYIEVAEKDRINFHDAPAKDPERFEKLLPYAIVFDLEKEWAGQFEGVHLGRSVWYEGAGQGRDIAREVAEFSRQASAYADPRGRLLAVGRE